MGWHFPCGPPSSWDAIGRLQGLSLRPRSNRMNAACLGFQNRRFKSAAGHSVAVLGRIRRAIAGPVGAFRSNEPNPRLALEPSRTDPAASSKSSAAAALTSNTVFSSEPGSSGAYYEGLVRASIARGGRHGDYSISVWWLRAVLAGMEGKYNGVDAVWESPEQYHPEADGRNR